MESDATAEQQPTLLELIEPARWQRLQDHFSRVMGVPIRTVSPSRKLLVRPSWPSSLLNNQTISLLRAGEELEQLIPSQHPPTESTSVTTSIGATYAAAPIRATADLLVGYFVIGPVVVGVREDELDFRHRVAAMGLDGAALWPVLLSLKLYTFAGIRSVLALTEEVGSSLAQFAYQAKELSEVLPSSSAVEQAVARYHSDHILRSLLSAATFVTHADGGSVMTFDPRGDNLHIQAAQGLSDEVVATTRLKRGEGIAGVALAERAILLVDEHTPDARLKSRMQRKELVSSIVAPITAEIVQEPIGVLNLRSASAEKRFTLEHVEVLRRLLDLARVALATLHVAFLNGRAPNQSTS